MQPIIKYVNVPPPHSLAPVTVAIVGAGFAGIGTAAALRRKGIDDFLILERAAGVGGVWRDNTYPCLLYTSDAADE